MDSGTVIKYTKRRPFHPFVLHLADGQALRVLHPEFMGVDDEVLALQLDDASRHVVDIEQMVSIEFLPGEGTPRESRP